MNHLMNRPVIKHPNKPNLIHPLAWLFFIAGLFAAAPVAAQTLPGPDANAPGTMSLQGVGEITATPDMAIITSGVVTIEETARAALNANSAAMSELFALLSAFKIDARDMQTSDFSIFPNYVRPNRRDNDGNPKPPRIASYQVSNTLNVIVRDLESLGRLLDLSVSVGANQIQSIRFGVTDTAPLFAEARRNAMADAIQKAELYAEAAGVRLGPIISISEPGASRPPFEPIMARMEPGAAVPVSAGELTFSRQVQVVWQLAPQD